MNEHYLVREPLHLHTLGHTADKKDLRPSHDSNKKELYRIHNPITLENYAEGWAAKDWMLYLRNTLLLALFVGVPTLLSCTLAAYAFAWMQFPGREALMLLNISLMLIPDAVTLVLRFVLMARMG